MANPLVAFDESGNTGQDLINPAQPVFSLASVHLSDSETDDTIQILSPKRGHEAKFETVKRSKSGRQRILAFLRSAYITPGKVKINIVHKPYMVTGKVVDLLIEPLAHQNSIDIYERGANIGLANLYHVSLPTLFGEARFASFQSHFVRMIRKKDRVSVKAFYNLCRNLYDTCREEWFKPLIATVLASEQIVGGMLSAVGTTSLDPAGTSFVQHCVAWGSQFGQEFDLVHDQSKPLEHERELLSFLMARNEPDVEVGYDRRKMILPLKATGITFGDSKTVRQLQVADVVAGASAYWAAGLAGAHVDTDFWKDLDACKVRDLIIGTIWPSHDVTPEALGTEEAGGINLVDYIAELVIRQKTGKRSDIRQDL